MACHVTEGPSAIFLVSKCGFRDDDGMMEELAKDVLFDESRMKNGEKKQWFRPCDMVNDLEPDLYLATKGEKQLMRMFGRTPHAVVEKALEEYNKVHSSNIAGKPVRKPHKKPCITCGTNFNELELDTDSESEEDEDEEDGLE